MIFCYVVFPPVLGATSFVASFWNDHWTPQCKHGAMCSKTRSFQVPTAVAFDKAPWWEHTGRCPYIIGEQTTLLQQCAFHHWAFAHPSAVTSLSPSAGEKYGEGLAIISAWCHWHTIYLLLLCVSRLIHQRQRLQPASTWCCWPQHSGGLIKGSIYDSQ